MAKRQQTQADDFRELLMGLDVSVADLARRSGLTKPSIYNAINGVHTPYRNTIMALSKALGVSMGRVEQAILESRRKAGAR